MGAFFTNVQIHIGAGAGVDARAAIVAAVRSFVVAEGFTEAAPDEEPDRSVVVDPVGGGAWIAVYDQATEDQDPRKLEALATALSRALGTTAVTVLVHDSDMLDLMLFHRGELSDRRRYPRSSARRKEAETDDLVARWTRLLRPGATEADLRAVLDRETERHVEATLFALADLLGWDMARTGVGFESLSYGEASGVSRIGFKLERRPAHERKAEGAPLLLQGAHQPKVALSVGEPLELHTSMLSTGGAARGLRILVWGEALERGLVDITEAQITSGRAGPAGVVVAPLRAQTSSEGLLHTVELPDFEVPSGLADLYAVARAEPGQFRRAMEAWSACDIRVSLSGRVLAKGRGALYIGYVVLGDPPAESSHRLDLEVTATARRPLRAPADAPPHVLRRLESRDTLFLLAALGADRERGARLAGLAMDRWAEVIAPDGAGAYETVSQSEPTARLKTGRLKASGLSKSKRWRELRGDLTSCLCFSATRCVRSVDDPLGAGTSGFGLSTSSNPHVLARGAAPQLTLWMDTARVPLERIDAAARVLGEIADQMMEQADASQAVRGRWGTFSFGYPIEMTDYEYVCGIQGTCTVLQSWVTRFLRGVTDDTVWLGRELLGRLGDLAELERVAEVTRVGAGARVRLRAPGAIEAFERALLPLLPSAEEWSGEVTRLYVR